MTARTIACRNPTAYKLVSRHRIGYER
jgi:hypothetical protein